jgi:hypothetical protein
MRLAQRKWVLLMGLVYVGCIGIALIGSRPGVSDTLTVSLFISAFAVCLIAPTIEWLMHASGTGIRLSGQGLNDKMEIRAFFLAVPYYTAYLLCCFAWKYAWLGVVGAALAFAIVIRILKNTVG